MCASLLQAGDDFAELPDAYRALLQTVLLVWQHSGHWNSPQRLLTLIRQICNQLIDHACKFAPSEYYDAG